MPTPLRIARHVRDASLTNLGGEHRAKPVPPEPDGLVADVDPALGQEILDVAKRQRESHVHHHDQTDDLWRAVEISEWIAHAPRLTQPEQPGNFALTPPSQWSRTFSTPRIPTRCCSSSRQWRRQARTARSSTSCRASILRGSMSFVQAALRRGAVARFPVALRRQSSATRAHRHLQSLLLRRSPRCACAPGTAQGAEATAETR